MQKTFWLDGRKGMSLPLLSSHAGADDGESPLWVQTADDDCVVDI